MHARLLRRAGPGPQYALVPSVSVTGPSRCGKRPRDAELTEVLHEL